MKTSPTTEEQLKAKVCKKCQILKPIDSFKLHRQRWHINECKDCVRSRMTLWHESKRQQVSEQHKKWLLANPERVRAHWERSRRKRVEELQDCYVNHTLGHLPSIPTELLETKRAQIQLKRLCKKLQTSAN
jgi:hypothetical protein